MASFNLAPKRVLWATFSNTISANPESLSNLIVEGEKQNLEIVFWNQGEFRRNTLHYFFPMVCFEKLSDRYQTWVPRFQARYPKMENAEDVVSYAVNHFSMLCDSIKPDLFVCWNRHDPTFGLPYSMSQELGIQCIDMERALLPKFISLGLNFREQPVEFSRTDEIKGEKLLRQNYTGHIYPQYASQIPNSIPYRTYTLILGSWDAVVDESEAIFAHSNALAIFLAKTFPETNFVYKTHPLATSCKETFRNLHISNADPIDLIKRSGAVITSGSKLELDVILSGKPLILAGRGFMYGSNKSVGKANSPAELVTILRSVDSWHDQDSAKSELAGFVGSRATSHWYSLENGDSDVQNVRLLLERLEQKTTSNQKPSLNESLTTYFKRFVNRFDHAGLSGVSGHDLINEVFGRLRRKISRCL